MLNKAIIMGRLTKEPEKRTTQSGTSVTTFTVAVDRPFKTRDAEKQTDFLNCVAWRQTADFVAQHFSKGQMIALVGSIQTRSYADRDGKNRTVVEIIADEVSFTGEKRDENRRPVEEPKEDYYRPGMVQDIYDEDDSDLPF